MIEEWFFDFLGPDFAHFVVLYMGIVVSATTIILLFKLAGKLLD